MVIRPPEYTLDHASEILGLRTEELLAAAEVGTITFVFIARVNTHAPEFPVEDENAPIFFSENGPGHKGFRVPRINEHGERIGIYYPSDSRLQIILYLEDIPKLADGRTIQKIGGFIYKPGAALLDRSNTYVELGRAMGICPPIYGVDPDYKTSFRRLFDVTIDDLRVPAEELWRFRQAQKGDDAPSAAIEQQEPHRFDYQRARDAWTEALKDLSAILHRELGYNANSTQGWIRMTTNPPQGYLIKKEGKMITTPGALPMDQAEFRRRWKKHTKKD